MNTDPFPLDSGAYVPDPERDTRLLIDGVFDSVARTVRAHGLGDPVPEMRARLDELAVRQEHRVVDEPARHNLRMTLALVFAYRFLRPALGSTAARVAVRKAFVEPLADTLCAGTRAMLDAVEDPFAAMVELSRSRETFAFGSGFVFEHAADDDRRYHVNVRHCFYHDVLRADGVAELTPQMCEFDATWIAAIDPDRHGFRFERATTIGRGGSHCRSTSIAWRRPRTKSDRGSGEAPRRGTMSGNRGAHHVSGCRATGFSEARACAPPRRPRFPRSGCPRRGRR